jgi:hypothetical protein
VGDSLLRNLLRTSQLLTYYLFLSDYTCALENEILPLDSSNAKQETSSHQEDAAIPMGVFGADSLAKSKLTLKLMPVFSSYGGQLIGSKGVSSQSVVLTTPTYSNPTQLMRVVPQTVPVSLQSAILSYGLTSNFTAIFSASIVQKQLNAQTFLGETSRIPLGLSYTGTKGFSDLTTSGVLKIYDDQINRIQIVTGFAYPLSSDTQNISLLQSNATYSNERAFYSLQPGSRTFDYLPGASYVGAAFPWSWGLSYRGRIPLSNNSQGWRFGDLHEFNSWVGYNYFPAVTSTIRLSNTLQGRIQGHDPQISGGSVPTDPNFYGGYLTEIFGGITIDGALIQHKEFSIEIESGVPIYQNLNGPQIRKNWQSGLAIKLKM